MMEWLISATKKLIYSRRGEPLHYGAHTLRYEVGTRLPRMSYATSDNAVVRNELAQVQLFLDRIRPGDFVLDIGGHTGQYAVLFGVLVGPSGRVVTFEPDPHARAVLERNLALNGLGDRVTIEPLALSDASGELTLWSRGGDSMSSLARTGLGTNADAPDVQAVRVPVQRLDMYLREHNLPAPDVVKLDVEGAEVHVLRGAGELLMSPAFIVCELHPYAWSELGVAEADLNALLDQGKRRFLRLTGEDDANGLGYGSGILEPLHA